MCYTDYSKNEDIKLMKIKKAFQAKFCGAGFVSAPQFFAKMRV